MESSKNPVSHPSEIAPGVPFPDAPGDIKNYEVGIMLPDDPELAVNMPESKKYILLAILSYTIMIAAWGSAIGSPATNVLMRIYHIGLPVSTLTVSLYVVGFAVGPIIWGPLGGIYGRKLPILVASFGMMLFFFAAGASKDFQTLVLCRFFQGFFGAGSLTLGPAVAGDIATPQTRGTFLTFVSFCVVAGPMIAPIVGGYITQSFLGWRWTQYITGIMSALDCILVLLFIPESHTITILQRRAANLRKTTGNWAIRAPGELEGWSFKGFFEEILAGPAKMLIREPILGLLTIYHGFIYGILYLCLGAIPIIYRGFKFEGANVFLPYISVLVGAILVCMINILVFEPWYNRQIKLKKKAVLPENRLPLMILASTSFVIGIFWFFWAGAYPNHVHWIVPTIGAAFLGFGIIGIFLSVFNYVLDTYLHHSAMAFASNTFFRSGFGCAFPLFTRPLIINLGIQWAGTLIGCLGVVMCPVPILFFIFGERLRKISPYAFYTEDSTLDQEGATQAMVAEQGSLCSQILADKR